MSTSNKRSLIFIIVFLLLTNISVLGYFLWFKEPSKPTNAGGSPKGMATSLETEVGFDETQIASYRKLKEEHWARIKPMFEDIRKTKDSLYGLLNQENVNDTLVNRIAESIGTKQKAIDLQAYTHFKQIRSLCRPDQVVKYDSIVQRMVRKMGKPNAKGDPKKK